MVIILSLLCFFANLQSAADSPDDCLAQEIQRMILSPSLAFHERSDFIQKQKEFSQMSLEKAANFALAFLQECHKTHVFSGTNAEWTSYFCLLVFKKTDSDIFAPIALNGTILSAPADIRPFHNKLEEDARQFCTEYLESISPSPHSKQIRQELCDIIPIASYTASLLKSSYFLPATLSQTKFFIRKYINFLFLSKRLEKNSLLHTFESSLGDHVQHISSIGSGSFITKKTIIGELITGKPTAIASFTTNMYVHQLLHAIQTIAAAQSCVQNMANFISTALDLT